MPDLEDVAGRHAVFQHIRLRQRLSITGEQESTVPVGQQDDNAHVVEVVIRFAGCEQINGQRAERQMLACFSLDDAAVLLFNRRNQLLKGF